VQAPVSSLWGVSFRWSSHCGKSPLTVVAERVLSRIVDTVRMQGLGTLLSNWVML
jgi:hypothetical protein